MEPLHQHIKFFTDFSLVSNFILSQFLFHKFWNYCNKVWFVFFRVTEKFKFAQKNFLLQWTLEELKIKDEFHNPISFGKPLRTQLLADLPPPRSLLYSITRKERKIMFNEVRRPYHTRGFNILGHLLWRPNCRELDLWDMKNWLWILR